MKTLLTLVATAGALAVAGCGSASSSVASQPPAADVSSAAGQQAATQATRDYSQDPASLLASRDGAADVAPYSVVLDQLEPLCTQDRVKIAGLGDSGLSDLEKNGIHDETRLTVLQHLRASIPSNGGKLDCIGVLSAYLVLREPH